MRWPLSQDYNEAIQSPAACFADPQLRQAQAVTDSLGLPAPCSGNFADVYALVARPHKWAVKCFTRQVPGLRERYEQISLYLARLRLSCVVDFTFQEQGIRVRGQWFPIVKMQWVEGFPLNQFVRDYLDQPAVLDQLCQAWLQLDRRLRDARLGHCDLQHGNVLLVPETEAGSGTLVVGMKLVDYDGMWVPALARHKPPELGHPSYQHPERRRQGTYGPELDRFSHLVIYTALRALAVAGLALWRRYDNGDNLLFTQADFETPDRSPLFAELLRTGHPEVRRLAGALRDAVRKPLDQVPLLDQALPEPKPAATPPVAASYQDPTASSGPREIHWSASRAVTPEGIPTNGAASPFANVGDAGATPEDTGQTREIPNALPTAWWKCPGVQAGVISVSLALIVTVAIIRMVKSPREEDFNARGRNPVNARSEPDPELPIIQDHPEVPALPAEQQLAPVSAMLKERNPGFDGTMTPTINDGVITGLAFVTDHVTDLRPLRTLPGLKTLACEGGTHGSCQLADLSPLKGMALTTLACRGNRIADLSPIKDMPLTLLACGGNPVADLSPLKGMQLTHLYCELTSIADLSPLKGMHLTSLTCWNTSISDLSPLADMRLAALLCGGTQVADLSPLKKMRLSILWCEGTLITDLSPLKGMPLTELHCQNPKLADLTPLKEVPLKRLWCNFRPERDTEILCSIKTLEQINGRPVAEILRPPPGQGFVPPINGKDLTGWSIGGARHG
jgi:hypothetical protein